MVKPKHKQNPLPMLKENQVLQKESTEEQIQYSIQWLTELWKDLGIEGTPDKEEVLNPTKTELETILLLRKYNI